MKRFVEGSDRGQSTLLPECLVVGVQMTNPGLVLSNPLASHRLRPLNPF